MTSARPLTNFPADYPVIANHIHSLYVGTKQRGQFAVAVLAGAKALSVNPNARLSIDHAMTLVAEIIDHADDLARTHGCLEEQPEGRGDGVLQFPRGESAGGGG